MTDMPPLQTLDDNAQILIKTLVKQLKINYPYTGIDYNSEIQGNGVFYEAIKSLITIWLCKCAPGTEHLIIKWLKIGAADLPNPEEAIKKLQHDHIMGSIVKYGLPQSKSFRFLIYNAKGAADPEIIHEVDEHSVVNDVDFVIVTETRLSGARSKHLDQTQYVGLTYRRFQPTVREIIGFGKDLLLRIIAQDSSICTPVYIELLDSCGISLPVTSRMQQPDIMSSLCEHGLATYFPPGFNIDTEDPVPANISLEQAEHNFAIESNDRAIYNFMAYGVVQVHIRIQTGINLSSGTPLYHLQFTLGRVNALAEVANVAIPFQHETELTRLLYNARGAALHSFRVHLLSMVEQYQPMILIVTETRLGVGEAHRVRTLIGYTQLICVNPIGYSGGIWLFSNMNNLSIDEIIRTETDLIVNLLNDDYTLPFIARLASSNELRQNPSLVTIVKIILKFVEDYTPLGRDGCILLKLWLGVMGNFDIDSFNLPVILNDNFILEQLFTRGAADYWRPRLSLQDCYVDIIDFKATERVVDVDIAGEQRTGFIITSLPTLAATLYTSFNLNLDNHFTLHNLKLIIPSNPEQQPSQNMQPMIILILNAGGIRNPTFTRRFTQLCHQHNPHAVLVTETRVGGVDGRNHRMSMNFPFTTYLKPIGYFGGQWLLWNSNVFSCQLICHTDRLLLAKLSINPQ
ncbi:Endonuclease/exonuclease/phosphatase [Corchorus olitorius]|uniref:Endonuclease/exonuclease/phosphatase n=1 Tax=Corchorus olitorius TaxID=93759 RepID=A0A1R3GA02_9ROSI|nr:Endonuclease/exonuclease/phosphatase [Corchorus olitorius]